MIGKLITIVILIAVALGVISGLLGFLGVYLPVIGFLTLCFIVIYIWYKNGGLFERIRKNKLLANPFEANQRKVLMIGSSFFQFWPDAAKDFAPIDVLNMGIGGTQIHNWTDYLDTTVAPYAPRGLIIYAGSNDFNIKTDPDKVLEDLKKLLEKIKQKFPSIPVLYVGICPTIARRDYWNDIQKFNSNARKLCEETENFHYTDSASVILNPDGSYQRDIYKFDRLHFNDSGYDRWRKAVIPAVKNIFPGR